MRKSFATAPSSGAARAIGVAMKRYGLIYADQGSARYVTGPADPRWADALEEFREHPLDGRALQVIRPWRRLVHC